MRSSGSISPTIENKASHQAGAVELESVEPQPPSRAVHSRPDHLETQLRDFLGPGLEQVDSLLRGCLESEFDVVSSLCKHAADMGGKRLRPMLVLLAADVGQSASPSPKADGYKDLRQDLLRIAAAVELVHAASLTHDDVMDNAVTRRHRSTVAHAAGPSSAILLGDLLFTKAYGLAAQTRSSYPARAIARAGTSLCEGELRQQMSAGHWTLSVREYRSILMQKTGALCAVSAELGVWQSLKGKSSVSREQMRWIRKKLRDYGMELGLGFQLFDDWLDFWGTDKVGKTLGTDLGQQKPTLPSLRFLSQLSAGEHRKWLHYLNTELEQDQGSAFLKALDRSDASDYTLRKAQACAARAIAHLQTLPKSAGREMLEKIARFSVARHA